ncbi:MAG TPA: hypothetical protein VMJ90_04165 [Anaerolineales bacterium]|nr:hypothetical protein [Anaerolineales bacterium]
MFDNLRESASESPFYEDDLNALKQEGTPKAARASVRRSGARFLGMTPPQRFMISLMLFFTVCVIGTLAMLILGKMGF